MWIQPEYIELKKCISDPVCFEGRIQIRVFLTVAVGSGLNIQCQVKYWSLLSLVAKMNTFFETIDKKASIKKKVLVLLYNNEVE